MVIFTAHNVIIDGKETLPGMELVENLEWFRLAKAELPEKCTLVDLGCLEGGYAYEFAKLGHDVTGVEVRKSNFEACKYVEQQCNIKNLTFVNSDAWDVKEKFDVVFCCGLFYHLDRPAAFMAHLAQMTGEKLILNTHFATADTKHRLSGRAVNEGYFGSWYDEGQTRDESAKWSSWGNGKSFWLELPELTRLCRNYFKEIKIKLVASDRVMITCYGKTTVS